MAKAKYISNDPDFPEVVAFHQPHTPEYWYVVVGGVALDVNTDSTYGTSTLDALLDVLNKIKKEASK